MASRSTPGSDDRKEPGRQFEVFEASEEELNGRCQQILGPGFEMELVDLVRQPVMNELPTEEGVR
jgi:hypothetical protein